MQARSLDVTEAVGRWALNDTIRTLGLFCTGWEDGANYQSDIIMNKL
jgi:hypothetical protein